MPLAIDGIVHLLDRYPTSVVGAAVLAAYSYLKTRTLTGPSVRFVDHLRATRWLSILLAFVAIKTSNRALNRLVRNHGWKADKPVWSFVRGQGDVVLLTGGANGIGAEMVDILARKTDKIAVLDMAPPSYKAKNVRYYQCDVTDPVSIAEVAKRVRADIGNPTINNAGIIRGKTILATTMEEYMLTYKVNFIGCHNILREFLPHIVTINHGHIMTTASSAAYVSLPQLGDYSSSKAAVLALHEVLNAELLHRYNAPRVRTSVVCPTKVETALGKGLKSVDHQFLIPTLQPSWLAARMVAIIESGLSDHLVAPVAAGFLLPAVRAMPAWFGWIVQATGKTNNAVTDAGNVEAKKVYSFVDELDVKHGL